MNKLIPFGKYRGKPVDILSSDPQYVKWILTQDGIKSKYPDLINIIINNFQEPSETPEHNKIQVKFLNKSYCAKLAWFVKELSISIFEDKEKKFKEYIFKQLKEIFSKDSFEYKKRFEELCIKSGVEISPFMLSRMNSTFLQSKPQMYEKEKKIISKVDKEILEEIEYRLHEIQELSGGVKLFINNLEFEKKGIDVSYSVCIGSNHELEIRDKYKVRLPFLSIPILIEIKPVVSDDFPAVLRQMNLSGAKILFISKYDGVGANLKDFIQYFKSQGITVIFESEIDSYTPSGFKKYYAEY